MIKYENLNVNPKNKKTTDCVIRALTVATGKSYYDVYEELYRLSIKTGWFMNETRLENKFLEQNGFVKMKQPRKSNNTKYLIGELDKLVDKNDIVIASCNKHLTVVKNYTLYDLWDCRGKTINSYYVKGR